MPAPQITALPDPPSRQDPTNFAVKGDAFLGALPTFATEANALATQVNERVDAAFDAGLEGAATNAANTVTKAAEARASELAAAGFANEAMLLSLGVETLRPSIKPSLLLDFARAQVVPPSVTFARASTATRVGPSGLIETMGINLPRINYDPVNRACLGLLIEEQRTNLLTYSEQFDNAAWTKSAATVTSNATTAPDGLTAADKIVEGASTAQHFVRQGNNLTGHTYSVFAKAGERSRFFIGQTSNSSGVEFNLLAGTATVRAGSYTGRIQPHANGWFKCSVTGDFNIPYIALLDNAGALSYLGDGISGLFLWGAQYEAGTFPTGYIPTTASAGTRAADVASVDNVSPWFRADEGTLFAEYLPGVSNEAQGVAAITDGTGNNRILILADQSIGLLTNERGLFVTTGGVAQTGLISTPDTPNQVSKMAGAYKRDDVALSVDGGAVLTDSLAEIPLVNKLQIGAQLPNTSILNGHVRKIAYFPQRLVNAQLQALTTL